MRKDVILTAEDVECRATEDDELVVPAEEVPVSHEQKQRSMTERLRELFQNPIAREIFRLIIEICPTPYLAYLVRCALLDIAPTSDTGENDDVTARRKHIPRPMNEPLILTGLERDAMAKQIDDERQAKKDKKALTDEWHALKEKMSPSKARAYKFTIFLAQYHPEDSAASEAENEQSGIAFLLVARSYVVDDNEDTMDIANEVVLEKEQWYEPPVIGTRIKCDRPEPEAIVLLRSHFEKFVGYMEDTKNHKREPRYCFCGCNDDTWQDVPSNMMECCNLKCPIKCSIHSKCLHDLIGQYTKAELFFFQRKSKFHWNCPYCKLTELDSQRS